MQWFPLAWERMSISQLRLGESTKCLKSRRLSIPFFWGGGGEGGFELGSTLKRFCLCYPGRVGLKLQLPLGPLPVAGLASRGVMENDHQHPLGCFSMSRPRWRGQLSYDFTT